MGAGGGIWETSDVITAARMNQKTALVAAAEPGTMYAGMIWFDSDDSMAYQRNKDNNVWHTLTKEELAHTITGLYTFNRGAAPPFAVDAASTKVANLDSDQVDGVDIPATIVEILTDHDKADHDALNIDADTVDGVDIPGTIANVLSDHNKAAHDALNIDADTLDGKDSGLSDDDICLLPVGVEGQVLIRGAAEWEAGSAVDVQQVYGEQDLDPGEHITFDFNGMVAIHQQGSGNFEVKGSASWRDIYSGASAGSPTLVCSANRVRSDSPAATNTKMISYAGWKFV